MDKKERCKELFENFFGPTAARLVDLMSDEECVSLCKAKVTSLLGPEKARVFDAIV